MSSYLTLIIFLIVVVGLIAFSARARRHQAAVAEHRAESIDVGTEVMTTSGLYGVVRARNDDDSVQLAIAPGVEVKWALAALREVAMLPSEYRGSAPAGQESDDWSGVGVRTENVRLDKQFDTESDTPGAGPTT